ncbi:MAG: hypothetical protein MJZ41_09565 [Bacteroidaceae bacterium]|nr:hypothetical protein [Bacteroidaceae bacterium]
MKEVFNPQSSQCRLDYHELLVPEVGYKLEKAITTTYSLDMETVMASFLSLGLDESTDSELLRNPISLLYAIKSLSRKVLIFCDSSKIKSPRKQNHLMNLLECAFVPVSLPKTEQGFPSFHPKTWLLEYVNPNTKDRKYKFIALSRNLTTDRSWDVSICLNGDTYTKSQAKTKPLINFVKFLKGQTSKLDNWYNERSVFIEDFLKRLNDVSFRTEDGDFSDFEILPIGIDNNKANPDEILFSSSNKLDSLTIMSPFISKGTIYNYLQRTDNPINLITRKYELGKIKELSGLNVYCLKDGIVNADIETEYDSARDEYVEYTYQSDIHAKIYCLTYKDAHYLYLGSMNASHFGEHRNVEMLLRLKSKLYSPKTFLKELSLDDDLKCAFEQIEFDNPAIEVEEDEEKGKFESIVKEICRMGGAAVVESRLDKSYNTKLSFISFIDDIGDMRIYPFFAQGKSISLKQEICFEGLQLTELSSFYVVSSGDYSSLIVIPTQGIPEDRDKKIISSIISNKRKLSEYIALILGMKPVNDLIEEIEESLGVEEIKEGKRKNIHRGDEIYPIYEKMLTAAYQDSSRLKEIGDLINMIDDDEIISQDFRNLYNTFKEATNL